MYLTQNRITWVSTDKNPFANPLCSLWFNSVIFRPIYLVRKISLAGGSTALCGIEAWSFGLVWGLKTLDGSARYRASSSIRARRFCGLPRSDRGWRILGGRLDLNML